MNRTPGKSYVDQMLVLLAEYGIQAHVHTPDGGVRGADSRISIIDDLASIDFSMLEQRIEATWGGRGRQSGDYFIAQLHRAQEQRLHDFHVVQRRTRTQTKHWETKAAIKSRQLRDRQKGK